MIAPAENKSRAGAQVSLKEVDFSLKDRVLRIISANPVVDYQSDITRGVKVLGSGRPLSMVDLGMVEIKGLQRPIVVVGPKETIARVKLKTGKQDEWFTHGIQFPLPSGGEGSFYWNRGSAHLQGLAHYLVGSQNPDKTYSVSGGPIEESVRNKDGVNHYNPWGSEGPAEFAILGVRCGFQTTVHTPSKDAWAWTVQCINVDGKYDNARG